MLPGEKHRRRRPPCSKADTFLPTKKNHDQCGGEQRPEGGKSAKKTAAGKKKRDRPAARACCKPKTGID